MHQPFPRTILLAAALVLATAAADGPPASKQTDPGPPADFKLQIALFEAGDNPVATAELIVRKGLAYQFVREAPEEVVIIDPARARVVLFDVSRNVRTELTPKRLDRALSRIHEDVRLKIEKYEKAGTRSDRVMASKYRDMIDPSFPETFDPASGRLTFSNATIKVEATGAAEPDGARLVSIANALAALVKLGAVHDASNLTPFARLQAIRSLVVTHGLRPTEIACVTRLSNPPQKFRWTFRVEPELTDRERLAIARIDVALPRTPLLPFEKYVEDED